MPLPPRSGPLFRAFMGASSTPTSSQAGTSGTISTASPNRVKPESKNSESEKKQRRNATLQGLPETWVGQC